MTQTTRFYNACRCVWEWITRHSRNTFFDQAAVDLEQKLCSNNPWWDGRDMLGVDRCVRGVRGT
jgi:hypothetical protein